MCPRSYMRSGPGRAAQRGDGCAAWDEIRADWDVIFAGYDYIDAVQDGCAVNIETSRRQHGRRFKGRVQP